MHQYLSIQKNNLADLFDIEYTKETLESKHYLGNESSLRLSFQGRGHFFSSLEFYVLRLGG